jgi:lathosterol oxidase
MFAMRVLIQCLIVGAFIFGIISSALRKKKTLAFTGLLLAIAATAWGGSSVQINETLRDGPAIGLDWFLLDMFLMAIIYVPLETLWPQYPEQGTFRNEWTLDVVYFMSTHLPIQVLSFLVLLPATQATKYLGVPALQHVIARMPWLCTRSLFCGAFMRFTTLRRRWTGSRARALTLSTTPWSADLSSFLSCLDFRNRSFSRI